MENINKIITCYHCGNKTLMRSVASYTHTYKKGGETLLNIGSRSLVSDATFTMYVCPICHYVTLELTGTEVFGDDFSGDILYPNVSVDKYDMPKSVSNAYEAALKVKNIDGAVCVLSLRRTLEKMFKDKGQTRGDLYQKIKKLSEEGILPPILDKMAGILRELGNMAAHGDDKEFSDDLVRSMIEFTKVILDYVYVLPRKLSIIQEKIGELPSVNDLAN